MYNKILGKRRVFKSGNTYRKEWIDKGILNLSKWVDRVNHVFPGFILDYGLDDNCMFIIMRNLEGTPADKIIHDDLFIEKMIDFCINNIKHTAPLAHMDWSMSNIIVNDNTIEMVDWDNLGMYPYSLVEYKLNHDLKLAFGNKLNHYIYLEKYNVRKF